jgi:hypothetical protein
MKKTLISIAAAALTMLIFASCAKDSGTNNQNAENKPENNNVLTSIIKKDATEEAEEAVKKMFKALKSYDIEEAQMYVDVDEIASEADTNENSTLFIKTAFESLDYKIVSSEKIDDDNVTVNTSITAIDMKPVMSEFFTKAMQYAFSIAFAETQPSEEEQNKKMEEILVECITKPDLANVTNEVSVKVSKINDEWKIEADDAFTNAVLGGLVDATNELNNSLNGNEEETENASTEEITFNDLHNWLVGDIWNDGFCDLSYYYEDGTSSTGAELDAEFAIDRLTKAYEEKSKYDNFVENLSDEYEELKGVYAKVSPEIDALYDEVMARGAKVVGEDLPTDKYQQYANVLYDLLWDLM